MASLSTDSKGNRTIQFTDENRRRRTVRLGKVSARLAEQARVYIGKIVACKKSGDAQDGETAKYISGLSQEWARKFAGAGLVTPRDVVLLKAFLDELIGSRTDLKQSSIHVYEMCRDGLVAHFGEKRDIRTITPGDADDWRIELVKQKYALATISKRIKVARQFFKRAVRKKLLEANPFQDVTTGSQANQSKCHFVDRETFAKVLEACPDNEWRLILALSRYGALRCPSETLSLRIVDIDWASSRIVVPSPKTESQGKPYRVVPLFPELRPYLDLEAMPDGAIYWVQRYRDIVHSNLRTHFKRILRRAGVEPWPRLFHNLRASRIMELADNYPAKVVADWTGNTERISQQHYQKATEQHFERAAGSATELRKDALQNALQTATAEPSQVVDSKPGKTSNPAEILDSALDGGIRRKEQSNPLGTEPRRS